MQFLPGMDTLLNRFVFVVFFRQRERLFVAPTRRSQRHHTELAELLAAFLFLPNRFNQCLKSRFEVGFVMDEEYVLPEEARVERLETSCRRRNR